jgi:dihydrofolate synthase/folylpolyglutamate synthase
MTYPEVLEYLFAQLPMFHRVGAAAYKPSLHNTQALCEWLQHPEKKIKTIHVGGTNGKGSTSHLIAAVLQSAGFKVGLYTSPHLLDFRERVKINGEWISQDFVIDFVERYKKSDCTSLQPSFFELTFALAVDYFCHEQVDIAIIEVGMGGRLDSTNVISPLLSVLTNVSKDHMQFLGNTIAAIATEKAGIIKTNTPVVLGPMKDEAKKVFVGMAQEQNSEITFAEHLPSIPPTSLGGDYQKENTQTAFHALKALQNCFHPFDDHHIHYGFANVQSLTGLRGRWEVIQKDHPTIIADVGHNEDGVKWVMQQVANQTFQSLHIVLGMVNDKDVDQVLSLFPKNAQYYFCKANIPRGMEAELLREKASLHALNGFSYPSVKAAFNQAKEKAHQDDFILITGSFFTVAEILD